MIRPPARAALITGAGALIGLILACIWVAMRSRQALERLVNPPGTNPTTSVYSRWVNLTPGQTQSANYLEEWLFRLQYRPVDRSPGLPGEFHREGETLEIYSRGFRYPDADYPAKPLRIRLRKGQLDLLRDQEGNTLPHWRLEPVRLTVWGVEDELRRPRVRIEELPRWVPDAVLAVEDKRFYQHQGIDVIGVARAIWADLRHRELRQGASTISQQLARSVFLDTRRTWKRKAVEAGLAFYLEWRFDKPKVLEMYLNGVYWGQDSHESVFGIEAAAQRYFGKSARSLTVAEAACLAGMLRSPNRYSPRTAPEAARLRRDVVLKLMRDQERITMQEYAEARRTPVRASPVPEREPELAYFLSWVRSQLEDLFTAEALSTQGWRIYTTVDPIWQKTAARALKPPAGQAALVALEPGTGAIRAWLGGTSFVHAPFDRVSRARRQPGSAFKPFVYLAGLDARVITPWTFLDDSPLRLSGRGGDWTPQNYDRKFRGRVPATRALAQSLNIPAVRAAQAVGIEAVIETARRAGIASALRGDLTSALGSSEVTLLELTGAYATLASGGIRAEPYGVDFIVGRDQQVLFAMPPTAERVFDPAPVYLLNRMLQAVFTEGTAQLARARGFLWPAAGKTGTSENFVDAWMIGYSPDLAIGVWVGEDRPASLGRSAASLALPIWTAAAASFWRDRPAWTWTPPEGIVTLSIDPESGVRARSGCPSRQEGAYLKGTEPSEDCPLHAGGIKGWIKNIMNRPGQ